MTSHDLSKYLRSVAQVLVDLPCHSLVRLSVKGTTKLLVQVEVHYFPVL